MVYKWSLGYFSYFCNANHIQRGIAAQKKRHIAVKRHLSPRLCDMAHLCVSM